MFGGLVVTPPALGVWPFRGPLQVLSREAVARLELVEPRSELLVRLSHGRARLLQSYSHSACRLWRQFWAASDSDIAIECGKRI